MTHDERVRLWSALSDAFVDNEIDYLEKARQLAGYDRAAVKAAFLESVAPVCHSNLQAPTPPIWRHSTAPGLPIPSTATCGLAGLPGYAACVTRFCLPTCVFDFVKRGVASSKGWKSEIPGEPAEGCGRGSEVARPGRAGAQCIQPARSRHRIVMPSRSKPYSYRKLRGAMLLSRLG